jgi:uncharacterized SAM-binding protein YcdF (DUF218 family)
MRERRGARLYFQRSRDVSAHLKRAARFALFRVTFACAILYLCIGFVTFDALEPGIPEEITDVGTAVVLSGAYERIHAGLSLLEKGRTKHLFISGANPGAGIQIETFERQFAAAHPGVISLKPCCIALGETADTTIQNALEIGCWLRQHKAEGPVLLVTSTYHMKRARAALGYVLPEVEITPYAVIDTLGQAGDLRGRSLQYLKLLATAAVLYLPVRALSPTLYGSFQTGCPSNVGRSLP